MNLSVIIPVFNEADAIEGTLFRIKEYLNQNGPETWEVIVVNNGSTDNTLYLLKKLQEKWLRVIDLSDTGGKGSALIAGSKVAGGDLWLWMDADSSADISELHKLDPYLHGADIIFGSRAIVGSQITEHQPRHREILGKLGNFLIQILLLPGVQDSQCGFKLLGPAAKKLVVQLHTQGFGIDVELLALAKRAGLRLQEVPITWKHNSSSAIRASSYFLTLFEVLKIFWRLNIKRSYEKP